ncbi:major facilitator superfamily domain-containing protein [Limtongia smithiae]|uniref:major facilitator superfamily domain-containing protein n=1 Tax=Limtongia smithiae TaxID=1125753 RepID=UPI0034CFA2BE
MVHYLDVPVSRRLIQVACAVVWCLLAAGPVFGFAALKTVWLHEGVYSDRCTPEENFAGVVCSTRELRINFIFTCASVVTNFAGVFVGLILDKFGPRLCQYFGGVLIFIGAIMLAFADSVLLLDLYVWGYIVLAIGGPFVYISSFHLSNAFPEYSGLILAVLTGAFDSSTAVYLVYRLIYNESEGRFHPKAFFLLYCVVPVFIIGATWAVMPAESYKDGGSLGRFLDEDEFGGEEEYEFAGTGAQSIDGVAIDTRTSGGMNDITISSTSTSSANSANEITPATVLNERSALLTKKTDGKDVYEYNAQEMKKLKISGVWGALHGRTVLQQISTPWFVLLCMFTVVMMVRINYFVASVRSQYDFIFGNAGVARVINEFFDIALPVGGIVTVPIAGYLLDNTSMTTALAVLLAMGTSMGILGNFASLTAAYTGIVIFVIHRSLFYTAVSDYSAKVFGFETFGQVYGLISTISGLFNFTQSGFDHITHRVLNRDPRPVNIGLVTLSTAIGTVFVWYVAKQSKKLKRSALEFEAEQATALRMPGYTSSVY